ncbi:hypothetical protein YQE_06261, partial [Dendroctonus ponderosae]
MRLFEVEKIVLGRLKEFCKTTSLHGWKYVVSSKPPAFIRREIITDRYPWKTAMNGFQSGLELVINNNPADYFASEIPSVGVKVLIHHPYKFPDLSLPSHIFEMNTNNLLGINPEMITATERLKSMPVRNRKCLFPSEKKLNMFQRYTRRGCLMECRLAMTLKVCKCVPFDLHSQSYSYGSLKVCGLEDLSCLNHNRGDSTTPIPAANE